MFLRTRGFEKTADQVPKDFVVHGSNYICAEVGSNTWFSEDVGVDLNRNYDFQFGKDEIGSSGNPCDEQYRGEHAFSESETAAVRDFILKFQERLGAVINFHA